MGDNSFLDLLVSVDIETTGSSSPLKYSMLSIGACRVVDISNTFYAELKPRHETGYEIEAMKIATQGLLLLEDNQRNHMNVYNPRSEVFDPKTVLDYLKKHAPDAKYALQTFSFWLEKLGFKPIFFGNPASFDKSFIDYYFDLYELPNKFGHQSRDLASFYEGWADMANMGTSYKTEPTIWPPDKELTHNALDDAIDQAVAMQNIISQKN